jgi:hypothetical protein
MVLRRVKRGTIYLLHKRRKSLGAIAADRGNRNMTIARTLSAG